MECPHCKKEITSVNVYTESWQKGFLDGNKIVSYGPNSVLETTEIECPECCGNIWDNVEEI
jgi:hypothetical protein